jgi:hypothetical protein
VGMVSPSARLKRDLMRRIFAVAVWMLLPATDAIPRAGAQHKIELGPEHQLLESLTGTFDADVKAYFLDAKKPKTSKGVLTRTMILGGNFLQESLTGEFFGSKFIGLGIVGFDQNKQKYVNTWCDSLSTTLMLTEGIYHEDRKTITYLGEDIEPNTKKKMKTRDVLKIISADSQTYEMFRLPAGEKTEVKIMEIHYTRKKKD